MNDLDTVHPLIEKLSCQSFMSSKAEAEAVEAASVEAASVEAEAVAEAEDTAAAKKNKMGCSIL